MAKATQSIDVLLEVVGFGENWTSRFIYTVDVLLEEPVLMLKEKS